MKSSKKILSFLVNVLPLIITLQSNLIVGMLSRTPGVTSQASSRAWPVLGNSAARAIGNPRFFAQFLTLTRFTSSIPPAHDNEFTRQTQFGFGGGSARDGGSSFPTQSRPDSSFPRSSGGILSSPIRTTNLQSPSIYPQSGLIRGRLNQPRRFSSDNSSNQGPLSSAHALLDLIEEIKALYKAYYAKPEQKSVQSKNPQ